MAGRGCCGPVVRTLRQRRATSEHAQGRRRAGRAEWDSAPRQMAGRECSSSPIQAFPFDVLWVNAMNSVCDPEWGARVRAIIRTRLETGTLRSAPPAPTWAGPGAQKPCDGCSSLIDNHDTEFEIVFHDGRAVRLHAGCHVVWEEERHRDREEDRRRDSVA